MAVVAGALALAASPAMADSPEAWQWGFQDTASSTAQAMVDLHHDIMFFITSIAFLTIYMFLQVTIC